MILLREGEHFRLLTIDEPDLDEARHVVVQAFNPWVEEILSGRTPHVLQLESGETITPWRQEPHGHA